MPGLGRSLVASLGVTMPHPFQSHSGPILLQEQGWFFRPIAHSGTLGPSAAWCSVSGPASSLRTTVCSALRPQHTLDSRIGLPSWLKPLPAIALWLQALEHCFVLLNDVANSPLPVKQYHILGCHTASDPRKSSGFSCWLISVHSFQLYALLDLHSEFCFISWFDSWRWGIGTCIAMVFRQFFPPHWKVASEFRTLICKSGKLIFMMVKFSGLLLSTAFPFKKVTRLLLHALQSSSVCTHWPNGELSCISKATFS